MPWGFNTKVKVKTVQTSAPKRKQKILAAFREQIWLRTFGKAYEGKCPTSWCQNTITVFDFQAGHNIPESKGGPTTPANLIPLCSRCNGSMSNNYTFTQWSALSPAVQQQQQQEQGNLPVAHVPVSMKRRFWCF